MALCEVHEPSQSGRGVVNFTCLIFIGPESCSVGGTKTEIRWQKLMGRNKQPVPGT